MYLCVYLFPTQFLLLVKELHQERTASVLPRLALFGVCHSINTGSLNAVPETTSISLHSVSVSQICFATVCLFACLSSKLSHREDPRHRHTLPLLLQSPYTEFLHTLGLRVHLKHCESFSDAQYLTLCSALTLQQFTTNHMSLLSWLALLCNIILSPGGHCCKEQPWNDRAKATTHNWPDSHTSNLN